MKKLPLLVVTGALCSGIALAASAQNAPSEQSLALRDDEQARIGRAIQLGRSFDSNTVDLEHEAKRMEVVSQAATSYEAVLLARLSRGYLQHQAPKSKPSEFKTPSAWTFVGYEEMDRFSTPVALALESHYSRAIKAAHALASSDAAVVRQHRRDRRERMRQFACGRLQQACPPSDGAYIIVTKDGQVWQREPFPEATKGATASPPKSSVAATAAETQVVVDPSVPDSDAPPDTYWHNGIIGSDSRTLRTWNTENAPWAAQSALAFHNFSGNTRAGMCSATKVGDRWAITAAHCLYNSYGFNQTNIFVQAMDGVEAHNHGSHTDGRGTPFGWKEAEWRGVTTEWFNDPGTDGFDIGMVWLPDTNEVCSAWWMGTSSISAGSSLSVYMFGYPGASNDCAASPVHGGECDGGLYGEGGSIKNWVHGNEAFTYQMDSQHGMSGSGVYKIVSGSRYVVGVNVGPHDSDENEASALTSAKHSWVAGLINNFACD